MAQQNADTRESDDDNATLFKRFVTRYSEEELSTLLIVAGAIMLFVPGLNLIGIPTVVLGVVVWFVDWLWG